LPAGQVLAFERGPTIPFSSDFIILDHVVVGDAGTLDGLAAPYDEETTTWIYKLQSTKLNFLDFWRQNQNRDIYSTMPWKPQRFSKPDSTGSR
jgi:hypothetical protein